MRNLAAIVDGTALRTPQIGGPTYLPKVPQSIGLIDWTASMQQVRNLVRATTRPYRGAWCDIRYRGNSVRMVIWDAMPYSNDGMPYSHDAAPQLPTGAIAGEFEGLPLIRCGDGVMLIKEFTVEPSLDRA
jgi:methionyl-tRNA formyltransferase